MTSSTIGQAAKSVPQCGYTASIPSTWTQGETKNFQMSKRLSVRFIGHFPGGPG